uniref:Inhibitor_I29 domain-containing protein n=1 Tax=Rhabditophanes sp. KR3021 TaxID=114890 RepID=A0AC35TL74_9BILA
MPDICVVNVGKTNSKSLERRLPKQLVLKSGIVEKSSNFDDKWNAFYGKYDNNYPTSREEGHRKNIFAANIEKNAKVNEYTDWTDAEFAAAYLMPYNRSRFSAIRDYTLVKELPNTMRKQMAETAEGPLPDFFDWREKEGVVAPVACQNHCGSCYSLDAPQQWKLFMLLLRVNQLSRSRNKRSLTVT